MATVKITINGVICDLYGRTITGPVKIVGEAMYTDVTPGHPLPPGEGPVDPGYGVPERPPHPAHPIVLPGDPGWGPPIDPPTEPPTQPPDPNWQWVYDRQHGWHPAYVPGEGDPQPH